MTKAVDRLHRVAARDPRALRADRTRLREDVLVAGHAHLVREHDVLVHLLVRDRAVEAVVRAEARHEEDHLRALATQAASLGDCADRHGAARALLDRRERERHPGAMLRTISYKDTGPTLISTAFLPAAMPVGLVGILALLLVAFLAGIAGAFLGIGGGILIVPFITLGLGVDQKIATAVSIVAVIATSSGAASIYVRDRMTNLRLGMWLEISTTIGAVLAALLVLYASSNLLAIL